MELVQLMQGDSIFLICKNLVCFLHIKNASSFFKSAKVGRYRGNFPSKQEGTREVSHPSGKIHG